jgi:hypothetical protein
MKAVSEALLGEDMSRRACIITGLLVGTLTPGLVQALPISPQVHPSRLTEPGDLLTLTLDRLVSLLSSSPGSTDRGTEGTRHGSAWTWEKEGPGLDPNGHH